MTTLIRCRNGHEYDPGDTAALTPTCPVCGVSDLLLPAPPSLPPDSRPPVELRADMGVPTIDFTPPRPDIPEYELLEEIGRGGMGVVYKARHRTTGMLAAVKVIRPERIGGTDMLTRFAREAIAGDRVEHPHIVRVIDAPVQGDAPCIIMEFVAGRTLQKLVEDVGALPVGVACELTRQTALALEHLAERKLIHRDVKPGNVMIEMPPGKDIPPRPTVKLLDLGVARLLKLNEGESIPATLTQAGSVIGTPDYTSPEQFLDPRAVDVRADLYSLGCTMYFLLTSRLPFPGGTSPYHKFDAHRSATAVGVEQHREEIPPVVAAVVRKLMNKRPEDRHQTPAELVADLEAALTALDSPYRPPTPVVAPGHVLAGHTGPVNAVAFTADGGRVVTGGADKSLRLWDVATGRHALTFGVTTHPVAALDVVPGSGVILAAQGIAVRGYHPTSGKELVKFTGHSNTVRCLCVTPDGRRVFSGGDDKLVRLWDASTGREIAKFAGHRDAVTGLALTLDGKRLLSAGKDNSLRVWDVSGGKEVRAFEVPRCPVLAVALTADGKGVCSAHFDRTVRLWDLESGAETRRYIGHLQRVAAIACTPAGRVLSGGHDKSIRLWGTAAGKEISVEAGLTADVLALALHGDGETALSGGADGAARLWRLPK